MDNLNLIDARVGAAIRRLRLSANLSARAFAEDVGVSADSLALMEAGRQRVEAATLLKVCRLLGVEVEVLYSPLGQPDENRMP